MSKKNIDWNRVGGDSVELKKNGYDVIELTKIHWHVKRPGSRTIVNIWPTVQKFMPNYARRASRYTDIVDAVKQSFLYEPMQKPHQSMQREVDKEAQEEASKLRIGGLEYFKSFIK